MKQNYFDFLKLPMGFELDETDLAARHRAIIATVHPDRFTDKSAVEQRVALQWSTFANQAFETLKSPIKRAHYLLQLHAPELATDGARVNLPPAFLMQQMTWREALEDGAADTVRHEVSTAHQDVLNDLRVACAAQDWTQVQVELAKVQFIDNFMKQIQSH